MQQIDWDNAYYVNNKDVISLLNTRSNSKNHKEKTNIERVLINRLLYLVHTRVRGYKDQHYYEDALQEGTMGLVRAFDEFDQSKGPNFFLVAKWYINSYVKNYMRKHHGKDDRFDCSFDCDSLTSEIQNAEEKYEKLQEYQQLCKAITALPNIEQNIINEHFGIQDDKPKTLQEIGDMYSISRQRVHQLQGKALLKLKYRLEKYS